MLIRFKHALFCFALVAATSQVNGAKADARDHDAVRLAVERGEILPLTKILAAIRGKVPGEIAGVEIERKAGRWVYEFRVVDGQGRVCEVYVDARTGDIDQIKGK